MSIWRGNLSWQWQEASDKASEVDLRQSWPGARPWFFRQAPGPLVCCIITGQPSSARAVHVVLA
jgi:hypothetical protein